MPVASGAKAQFVQRSNVAAEAATHKSPQLWSQSVMRPVFVGHGFSGAISCTVGSGFSRWLLCYQDQRSK
jgi:hypothetical protein